MSHLDNFEWQSFTADGFESFSGRTVETNRGELTVTMSKISSLLFTKYTRCSEPTLLGLLLACRWVF